MIPYGKQSILEDDIEAVVDVLRSDFLTQGPAVPRFENAVKEYCGTAHAVAVNSATSALHLACLAIDLGPGDTLWTSSNTFVASANCALYCGASVDFIDIDFDTGNLSVSALEQKLEIRASKGQLPKVVVAVHYAGLSCDMEALAGLVSKYGFYLFEDASHAFGSEYQGKKIGGCQYSDLTIFSFHPVKIITSGEGGMVLTNSAELSERIQRLRIHGISRDVAVMSEPSHGPWYYQQLELGYNYRMSDIHAALGRSQLDHIDQIIQRRNALAHRYHEKLSNLPLQLPVSLQDCTSSWHLYVVRLVEGETEVERKALFMALRKKGIGVQVHYIPVHTQPYYQQLGFSWGDYPQAEKHYRLTLTLPLYPTLSDAEQDYVVQQLRIALSA